VAGVSFLWLVFQVETARRRDPDEPESQDVGYAAAA